MYAHTLEHLRAGRVEEALLPYARCHPRTFWDWFLEFAWEGNMHAIDWLGVHIVPQRLPQQEPFCRPVLQALIDKPWHGTDALAGEAMQAALLSVRFTVYPRRASLGAATLRDRHPGVFTPARDGPWRVFCLSLFLARGAVGTASLLRIIQPDAHPGRPDPPRRAPARPWLGEAWIHAS